MEKKTKDYLLIGGIIAAALAVMWLVLAPAPASAADLGGSCCADLEERIAELESTVARKGNKKVSLTIAGQVNTALVYVDIDTGGGGGYTNTTIQQNGNEETYLGAYVNARINGDLTAGAVLEIDARDLGVLGQPIGGVDTGLRQSNFWIKSEAVGKLTVGRAAQATKDFDDIRTDNGGVAQKALSLGALSDAHLTGIDVPFDGQFRDVVRYDSPAWNGFKLSASWANSTDINAADGNGDTYDVALRYWQQYAGFQIAGGLGYRKGTDLEINVLGITTVSLPTGDVETLLAAGSLKHLDTGLFATVNWADQDYQDFNFTLKGYALTAGIERKWNSLGATTLYGEWNRLDIDTGGGSGEIDVYGAGVVQAIDAAALEVYLSYRNYDLGDVSAGADITAVTAGARIKF